MWIPCSLCLVVWFTVSAFGQNEVRMPPSITNGPKRSEIFRLGNSVDLGCKAEGTPPVTYEWKKNGADLNLNLPNINRGPDGNITINPTTPLDEGFYQCFARNQFGRALSITTHIQRAFLDDSLQGPGVVPVTVTEGLPFFIQAARRASFPQPRYDWEIATNSVDPHPRPLHQSQRIQSACNGDLYFAYAEKKDELDGHIYKSTVYNPNLDEKKGGSYTKLTVKQSSGSLREFAPNISYAALTQEVALIGGSIILKCFFSGNPLPTIRWSRQPQGRHSLSPFRTELTISGIQKSDEGNYVCTGENSKGSYQHTLVVRVEAEPKFLRESDGPRNVNVTEHESVTFKCFAFAEPEAEVVWLRNGEVIDVTKAPRRFSFSDDKKSLTIRDVCRDCKDPDLTVIQCNASNVHGYAFASGYVNVLRRTQVLLVGSTSEQLDLTKENHLQFNCNATSDPSTPPAVQWKWKSLLTEREETVHNATPYVFVMNGKLTINIGSNCSTKCHEYLGVYSCIGYNGYSRDIATMTLNATGTFNGASEASLLWIVIVAAIVCFLLLLLVLCCIVFQLRNGDEYDVDSKERKSGRNPEKEIEDCGFQDYYPREMKGSQQSLVSCDMFKGVDAVVVNEYEDDDGDFREDGSFVGRYNEKPF